MSWGATIYDFTATTIDGREEGLVKFRGKTLLIVNTASLCGYTPQYKGLEELYQKYRDRGFLVLAFPANNFKEQEPGGNDDIKKFCELKYQITFPLFAKISVKGDDIHPLYRYLTTGSRFPGEISWNFNKFLVDPAGTVVARFDSATEPQGPEITKAMEEILALPDHATEATVNAP